MSAKKSLPRGALARAEKVLAALQARYPRPATHLEADNAWELLVATVLAAQMCIRDRDRPRHSA